MSDRQTDTSRELQYLLKLHIWTNIVNIQHQNNKNKFNKIIIRFCLSFVCSLLCHGDFLNYMKPQCGHCDVRWRVLSHAPTYQFSGKSFTYHYIELRRYVRLLKGQPRVEALILLPCQIIPVGYVLDATCVEGLWPLDRPFAFRGTAWLYSGVQVKPELTTSLFLPICVNTLFRKR